jgi:hypothetical protein
MQQKAEAAEVTSTRMAIALATAGRSCFTLRCGRQAGGLPGTSAAHANGEAQPDLSPSPVSTSLAEVVADLRAVLVIRSACTCGRRGPEPSWATGSEFVQLVIANC